MCLSACMCGYWVEMLLNIVVPIQILWLRSWAMSVTNLILILASGTIYQLNEDKLRKRLHIVGIFSPRHFHLSFVTKLLTKS